MGCFLACFGSSKNNKRLRKPPPSPKLGTSYEPVLRDLPPKPAIVQESVPAVLRSSPGKKEEELSVGLPKKVTFDSSVSKSVEKAVEISLETGKSVDEEAVVSGGSALSSLGSYPPNHRYHNCRESDNEDEMEEIDVDDYDVDKDVVDEVYDEFDVEEDSPKTNQERTPGSFSSMESRTKSVTQCLPMRDLDGMVLSTAENLTQLKGELPLGQKDEQEHAVDASLSGWLGSSQKTPEKKAITRGLEAIPSEGTASSHGSNSVRSFSDRPILGALNMDDFKMVASPSPRRSPCHNADDRPIIGSVGSHWSEETPSVPAGSVSSFKGIPNTTSKYQEDKKVNWHSTPFETRLEQALKRGASGVPF